MSDPMIAIREARPHELAAAGDVVVRAYRALGGGGDAHEAYLEHVRDAAGRARHCPVLVAVDEGTGEVLGSVTYVPGQGNAFAELAGEGEGEFRMLGVAPDAQGRGVGAALVRACIDLARAGGRHGIVISTTPVMHAAHRLYEHLGFRRAPERDWVPVPGIELWAYVLAL
ncbi:MAG: GNAT family N-acetyltransferase [Chloroflexota bacterium]